MKITIKTEFAEHEFEMTPEKVSGLFIKAFQYEKECSDRLREDGNKVDQLPTPPTQTERPVDVSVNRTPRVCAEHIVISFVCNQNRECKECGNEPYKEE